MILSERVPSKLSVGSLTAITVLALGSLPGWIQAQTPPPPRDTEPAKVAVPAVEPPDVVLERVAVPVRVRTADGAGLAPVVAAEPVPVGAAQRPAGDENRIDAVEKKLEQLIDEVKALRGTRSVAARVAPPAQEVRKRTLTPGASSDVQALSRATYRLPKAKAEALATFLREHMKSPAEVKVEEDNLIVTTSPQAQATIGQFIALSEGNEQPSHAFWYSGGNQPQTTVYGTVPGQAVYELVPSKVSPTPTPAKK